jgi:hypothetical protein
MPAAGVQAAALNILSWAHESMIADRRTAQARKEAPTWVAMAPIQTLCDTALARSDTRAEERGGATEPVRRRAHNNNQTAAAHRATETAAVAAAHDDTSVRDRPNDADRVRSTHGVGTQRASCDDDDHPPLAPSSWEASTTAAGNRHQAAARSTQPAVVRASVTSDATSDDDSAQQAAAAQRMHRHHTHAGCAIDSDDGVQAWQQPGANAQAAVRCVGVAARAWDYCCASGQRGAHKGPTEHVHAATIEEAEVVPTSAVGATKCVRTRALDAIRDVQNNDRAHMMKDGFQSLDSALDQSADSVEHRAPSDHAVC